MKSPSHKEVLWWRVSHGCALTANAVSLPCSPCSQWLVPAARFAWHLGPGRSMGYFEVSLNLIVILQQTLPQREAQPGQELCTGSLLQLCHMWKLIIKVRFVWKGLFSNNSVPDPGLLGKAASRAGNWSPKMVHQFPATHLLKTSTVPNAEPCSYIKITLWHSKC